MQIIFIMIIFFVAIIGLIIGSFVSCVSYRMAKHESFILTRSKCVKCETPLKARNLFPLFSYIFQRGKCSNCHQKISIKYPLIEIFFAAIFVFIYIHFGKKIDAQFLLICAITTVMTIMSLVDLEEYFIPDSLQYLFAFLSCLFLLNSGNGYHTIIDNLSSAFIYMGFGLLLYLYFYVFGRVSAIGIDDIKFLFIAGLLIGTKGFLSFILMSGIFGIIFGTLWLKLKKEEFFPFAPALCIAVFISLILDKKFNIIDFIASTLFFQI